MDDSPASHRDVIDRWPSLRAFADDIGEAYGTAKAMRRRESIPAEHWPAVVQSAALREIDGVTFEALALMAAAKAKAADEQREAAAP